MQALILAGGKGSRLRELNLNKPKPLIDFSGLPFIVHLIKFLIKNYKIKKIILSICFKKELFFEIDALNNFDVQIDFVEEKEPLGTGGALLNCMKNISDEYFLILNGDTIFNCNIKNMFSIAKKYKKSVVASKKIDSSKSNYNILCQDQKIQSIGSKKNSQKTYNQKYNSAGLCVLKYSSIKELLNEISFMNLEDDILSRLVDHGMLLNYSTNVDFFDYGTIDNYKKLKTLSDFNFSKAVDLLK